MFSSRLPYAPSAGKGNLLSWEDGQIGAMCMGVSPLE